MPNSTRTFVAAAACYNLASMSSWLQPALLSDYGSRLHLPANLTGAIATSELAMMAATLLFLPRLVRGTRLNIIAAAGLALTIVATLCSLQDCNITVLVVSRMITGIGYGMLLLVSTIAMTGSPNPQAGFGRMYSFNLVTSSALLALVPWLAKLFPAGSGFILYLCYAVLLLPFIALMPSEMRFAVPDPVKVPRRRIGEFIPLAAADSLLGLTYGAIWAFFITLALKAGLSATQAGTVAAVCLLWAMVGSLSAPYFSRLVGAHRLLLIAVAGIFVGLELVVASHSPIWFTLGGSLTLVCYYLLYPTLMGIASGMDPSGRGNAFILSQVMIFFAAGPYFGGLLMSSAGTTGLAILPAFACGAAFLLLLVALSRASRASLTAAAT